MRHAIERYLIDATPASRCLLSIGVGSPSLALALGLITWAQHSPEVAPKLHHQAIVSAQWCLVASLLVLGGLTLWLWPRRQAQRIALGVELAVGLSIGVSFSVLNCLSGLYGASGHLILLGATTVGMLLLNWRAMIITIALCALGLITWEWLMWYRIVPYAGAITPDAFVNGQPSWWWRTWHGITLYIGMVVTVTLIMMLFSSQDALRRRLSRLAVTDGLTGLANRRHFMDRLRIELARQRRSGRPLSVVSIDADHFKHVNDQYGHAVGDEVLAALAGTLSIGVRAPTDLAARLGGEEFALLLPDTPLAEAQAVCQRLQALLPTRAVQGPGGPLSVTLSMGVVESQGMEASSVLRAADANLYQAKQSGRNCVVSSVITPPTGKEAPR
jgi:diguanylate cyclase (GGDEF)-like protein